MKKLSEIWVVVVEEQFVPCSKCGAAAEQPCDIPVPKGAHLWSALPRGGRNGEVHTERRDAFATWKQLVKLGGRLGG